MEDTITQSQERTEKTMRKIPDLNVAIVHDYLNQYGGAERCLEVFHELFPRAPIFTLVYNEDTLPQYNQWDIRPSLLQHFPMIHQHYKYYFPWFPFVVKTFPLKKFDLVISISQAWVKGIRTGHVPHVSFCLTPVRYAWDLYEEYMLYEYIPPLGKKVLPLLAWMLRRWDRRQAQRIDHFIAISKTVQDRIRKYYNCSSTVIYPPVNTSFYHIDSSVKREDFYMTVSRLKAYKRIDLIVEAFNELGYPLTVIGKGSELDSLMKRAKGNVRFYTDLSDESVRSFYQRAKGFVFAGREDFGIVNAEANACGLPVIAYGEGGAAEVVHDGINGVIFTEQTKQSLIDAIRRFEAMSFAPEEVRARSLRFDRNTFKESFISFIHEKINNEGLCLPS